MTQERDAKYPALFRVGEGAMIYAPALRGDPHWRTLLEIEKPHGHIRLPAGDPGTLGSIYLGPEEYVVRLEHVLLVRAPNIPDWVADHAAASFAAAQALFTREMNVALPERPLVVLTLHDNGRGLVADVTPGPTAGFRLYGASWNAFNTEDAADLQRVIFHEAFHFWNGGLANNAAATPSWLHEGGADYAALRAGVETGAIDDAGARDVFDAWAQTIATARTRPERYYRLADFYAAADMPTPALPIELLVNRRGPERWDEMPAALNALGADVITAPNADTRRTAALMHVLRLACAASDEGFGFFSGGDVVLDTHAGCGTLAGDPRLIAIEGYDPNEMSDAAYAAVQSRCAAGRPVRLTLEGPRVVNISCRTPLEAAPNAFDVRSWR